MAFYVDDPEAAASAPAPAAVANPGWFQPENVAAGTGATLITVDWLNTVTAEPINLVSGVGITPSKTNNAQVAQALRRLTAGNLTRITANATLGVDSGQVQVSAAAASIALTLPAANAAAGTPYPLLLVRTDTAAGNSVTVSVPSGDALLPGGAASFTLPVAGVALLYADGTTNFLLFQNAPAHGSELFAAPGSANFTVPAGVYNVFARAWGAGAGGGYSPAPGAVGGGGGGGGYLEGWFGVTPGQVVTVDVGAGGAGATGSTPGASGGATTINGWSTGTAEGGGEGVPGSPGNGGAAGTPSGGTFAWPGDMGGVGYPAGTDSYGQVMVTGTGGGTYGFTSHPGASSHAFAGANGWAPGVGGQGGNNGGAGGNGANGQVILSW